MKPADRRWWTIAAVLLGMGAATLLVLSALRQNIAYFRTPSELVSGQYPERGTGRALRLGGMVEKHSVQRDGTRIDFRVTDFSHSVPVQYNGIVPDLFREGQGVVADGAMNAEGMFIAERILAKHDEKYMPPVNKNKNQEIKSKNDKINSP